MRKENIRRMFFFFFFKKEREMNTFYLKVYGRRDREVEICFYIKLFLINLRDKIVKSPI